MNDDKTIDDRDIADLLPFYATDRLVARDRVRVAAALNVDRALRHELAVVREERQVTIEANESLGTPSRQARDRFFEMLEAQRSRNGPARFDLSGWIAARVDRLRPQTLAWSLAALVLVSIAQAGVIGLMLAPKAGFETASVSTPSAGGPAGALIIVAFASDATAADIENLLRQNSATIVAGPLPGGLYQLRAGGLGQSTAATTKIVDALKARPSIVRFAAPGNETE